MEAAEQVGLKLKTENTSQQSTTMASFVISPMRFVLLGDSITQMGFSVGGWAGRLAEQYVRRADIVNRGFSGYNTRWVLPALPHIFPVPMTLPIQLVTVFYGANDAADAKLNARQHIPIIEYKQNLTAILDHIGLSCPEAAIVVITPPPVHAEKYREFCKSKNGGSLPTDWQPDRSLEVAGEYAKAASSTVAAMSKRGSGCLNCIDLWSTMQEEAPGGAWGEYLSDGLHLTESGNEFLFLKVGQSCI